MRVAVIGCGCVGLVTGLGLASVGHEVVGVEVDRERRRALIAGRLPFHEPGLAEQLRAESAAARFEVSGDARQCGDRDVILVSVQTPPGHDGSIDLRFLEAAVDEIAAVLAGEPRRPRVVAIRSTVLPGTAEHVVRPRLDGLASVASNPEFLREGTAVSDFLHPDRIVVGADTAEAYGLLCDLYEPLHAPIVRTTPATAELAKYASNALLATLISFSNEMARVCEELPGVDVEDVLHIVHRDGRLSPVVDGEVISPGILAYLKAGCGFGGSCLPKDVSALLAEQASRGHKHPLLEAVLAVNETQAEHVVDLLTRRLGELEGRSVAVLGAAFKGGTDDLRASQGLRILDHLLDRRARAAVFDPLVRSAALHDYRDRGVCIAESLEEALEVTEACVVATNAPEFAALADVVRRLKNPGYLVLDGRRFLDPASMDGRYLGVGRGPETIREADRPQEPRQEVWPG